MTEDMPASSLSTEEPWTVRRILEWTTSYLQQHGSETARLDAEILLSHARGCDRIDLYTRYHEQLSQQERDTMRSQIRKRAQAVPVAYLVGFREFFSLEFQVSPHVLIPRPDTETLVVELLERIKSKPQPAVLDIGTGSGCIAIATAKNNQHVKLTATDICQNALQIAIENASRHKVSHRIEFMHGNLFSPLKPQRQFDAIVSNPPYIRIDEMATLPADIRLHEPESALVAGEEGLDIVRQLIQQANPFLKPGGVLMIEIDPAQTNAVTQLANSVSCFNSIHFCKDIAGRNRVVCLTLQN